MHHIVIDVFCDLDKKHQNGDDNIPIISDTLF